MKYSILTVALLAVALAACDKQDDAMPASSSSDQVVTPDQATPVMPAPAEPAPAPEAAAPAATPEAAPPPEAAAPAAAPAAPAPAEPAPAMSESAPTEAMPDAQSAAPAGEMPADAMPPTPGDQAAAPAAAQGAAMSMEEGSALAKKSGCFACHNIERKIIGPSWNDVGAKYKGDPAARDTMVKWIHTGGTGRWGTAVMPPYSPRVADADIEKLADFILSLPQS